MAKQIEFIRNGTVIDHIKAGEAFQVLEILKLTDHIRKGDCKVMIGCNFESGAHSFKDIIKISNGFLTHKELNQITLIAPKATVSIIRNFKIVEKYKLEVEKDIVNVIRCGNPNCITNNEKMGSYFHTYSIENGEFQCHYCETILPKDQLEFI